MRANLSKKAKSSSVNLIKAILGDNYLNELKNKGGQSPKGDKELLKLDESR
jgi:hypothetical protein